MNKKNRIKVLLIEDNPGDIRIIREMLSEDSHNVFEVVQADHLSQGLECLKDDNIDVILLDLGLPDSQGIDTLHAILSVAEHLPIIIQTGLNDEEIAIRAVKAGAQDYLIKGQMNSFLLSRSILHSIERKRIKEELRISEERLKILFQEGPIPTFTWQKRGDSFFLIDFNLAAISVTDNKVCNFLDKGAEALSQDQPQLLDDMRRCFTEHLVIRRELTSKYFYPGKQMSVQYAFVPPDLIILHAEDITERKQAEAELKKSESKYRFLTEKMTDIIWILDMNLRTTYVSPSIKKTLGFTTEERMAQNVTDQITPDSFARIQNLLFEELEREKNGNADPDRTLKIELEYYHKNGSTVWLESIISGIRDDRGSLMGIHGLSRDISERKKMEVAVRERNKELRCLYAIGEIIEMKDTIKETFRWSVDFLTQAFYFSEYACARITFGDQEFKTGNFQETIWKMSVDLIVQGKKVGILEVRYLKEMPEKDEGPFLKEERNLINSVAMRLGRFVEHKHMEKELKKSEQKYKELSITDSLSQLYNTRYFYDQLQMETGRSNRYGQPLTLILLDLDDFKAYNDAYGHIEGDKVITRLGQVIKRCLRKTDSAYRYGGEEFTILLPMTGSTSGAVTAERIRTEFKEEIFMPVPDKEVHMTVSIGCGQYQTNEGMKGFVHRVDQLMYQAKANGKDTVCSMS
ncbi:MAG: hypothetical protein APR62_05320 [Smithella sp. SDB]|nr:MAG: hypothetical protein APR62_05320 [Smithella sp. SDB]